MNLAQFRSSLRTRMGVPSNDAFYTDNVCDNFVNAALRDIDGAAAWRWNEDEQSVDIVNGTRSYDLPERYKASLFVATSEGFELERATAAHHRLLRGASGRPKVWDIYGSQLRVAPNPDGAYTLTHAYLKGEVSLDADEEEPILPVVWHQAVIERAVYLAHRRWGNLEEAGAALAAYQGLLDQMKPNARGYSEDTGGGEVPVVAPEATA